MSNRFVRLDHGCQNLVVSPGLRVTSVGYGWCVDDGSHFSEWALVIQYTTRQDGKTSWMVSLAEVDGLVKVKGGLTTKDSIYKAINRLTKHWVSPLNVLPPFEYEVALPVEDYLNGDDGEVAFEDAREADGDAKKVFLAEAKDAGLKNVKVKSVEFQEFDSGNISHAGAYFLVKYTADRPLDDSCHESACPNAKAGRHV